MNVIRAEEAAKIVADEIGRMMREDYELKGRYENGCLVAVGMEAICRESRKELNMAKYGIELGESSIESSSKKKVLSNASPAIGRIFACAANSRLCGIRSSYVSNSREGTENNRRGCIGFDIMKRCGLFHKKDKGWVRYFVSVQLNGAKDELNESLAASSARVLMKAAERRVLEAILEVEDDMPSSECAVVKPAEVISMIAAK